MFRSRLALSVVGFAIALATMQCFSSSAASAKDGGLLGVEGILTSIDVAAGSLTIRTRRMQDVTVTVNASTRIERNERRATLAMFKVGDRVEAKLTSASSNLAIKVEAVGP